MTDHAGQPADHQAGDPARHPARIVVVGAGIAGLSVAERLRARGYAGGLALLGAEGTAPYDRPPLSKAVLRGEADGTDLRTGEQLRALDADLRFDEPAVGLDVDHRTVRTTAGRVTGDAVVIATGARARRIAGVDGHVLRTRQDAATLRAALASARRIAVVGAGLVGCEVAASARVLGIEVALHDVLAGPMVRVVGATVSQVVADLHRSHGVELHTSTIVSRDTGRRLLADGRPVEADVVVEAVGGTPDLGWLAGSGLTLGHGVACDEDGRAAPGIYAVGDVAAWAGRRTEHWTAATVQADHVAARLLGQEPPAREPSYWWSDQYDLKIQGIGSPHADDAVHLLEWGPRRRTVALYAAAGRLTGAVGFSAPAAVLRLGADVTAGTAVDEVVDRLTAPRASAAGRQRRPEGSPR